MKGRPRILHIAFNQLRKLPVLTAELLSFRDTARLSLIVPSYDQHRETLDHQLEGIRIHYVRLRTRDWSVRQTPLLKLLRFFEFTVKAFFRAVIIRPHLYVGHDMPGMLPLLPFVLLRPRRVVFAAHELWTEAAENNAPLRPLWRLLERWIVRRVARVVVPEANRARIMHEEYAARILPAVVRNIPDDVSDIPRNNSLRTVLSLEERDVIVLYQGLVASSRCLEELIDAAALLSDDVHIVIIGEGDSAYEEALRRKAARFPHRVHFLPWTPQHRLREFTASADIGVLFYRNEGRNNYYAAPNKLYEYLFAGVPLVSSDFPGLKAVIETGGYGACSAPDDAARIAKAIRAAACIQGGDALANRARNEFRWENEASVLRAVYEDIVGGQHVD
jgi:glycosyltransferase involved in cell wall biosynthesis